MNNCRNGKKKRRPRMPQLDTVLTASAKQNHQSGHTQHQKGYRKQNIIVFSTDRAIAKRAFIPCPVHFDVPNGKEQEHQSRHLVQIAVLTTHSRAPAMAAEQMKAKA